MALSLEPYVKQFLTEKLSRLVVESPEGVLTICKVALLSPGAILAYPTNSRFRLDFSILVAAHYDLYTSAGTSEGKINISISSKTGIRYGNPTPPIHPVTHGLLTKQLGLVFSNFESGMITQTMSVMIKQGRSPSWESFPDDPISVLALRNAVRNSNPELSSHTEEEIQEIRDYCQNLFDEMDLGDVEDHVTYRRFVQRKRNFSVVLEGAKPKHVYAALTQPHLVACWAHTIPIMAEGPVNLGQFQYSRFSGSVANFEPDQYLLIQWRVAEWPWGKHARVRFDFKPSETSCTVEVDVVGIPKDQEDLVQEIFLREYFEEMGRCFGWEVTETAKLLRGEYSEQ